MDLTWHTITNERSVMSSAEQMEYAHQCLKQLLEIDERILCLHKERDKQFIEELQLQALAIQQQADRILLTSVS